MSAKLIDTANLWVELNKVPEFKLILDQLSSSTNASTLLASDYGVVGDGVTDNTDAINSAIAAAVQQSKKTVKLPGGVVLVTASHLKTASVKHSGINLPAGMELRGNSATTTTLFIAGAPAGATFDKTDTSVYGNSGYTSNANFLPGITAAENCRISNLKVDGNLPNQINTIRTTGLGGNATPQPEPHPYLNPWWYPTEQNTEGMGIFVRGANTVIENVIVENTAGFNVRFHDAPNGKVTNCLISVGVNGGVGFTGASEGGLIIGGEVFDTHSDCIRLHANNIIVDGVKIHHARRNQFAPNSPNYAGVYTEGGVSGCIIQNCEIYGNSDMGIDFNSSGNTAINNKIYRNGCAGIQTTGRNYTIKNNIIRDNGLDLSGKPYVGDYHPVGIITAPEDFNSTISGNTFSNTDGKQTHGIANRYGQTLLKNTNVFNNTFTGLTAFGQPVDASSLVYDNTPASANNTTTPGTPTTPTPTPTTPTPTPGARRVNANDASIVYTGKWALLGDAEGSRFNTDGGNLVINNIPENAFKLYGVKSEYFDTMRLGHDADLLKDIDTSLPAGQGNSAVQLLYESDKLTTPWGLFLGHTANTNKSIGFTYIEFFNKA